MVDLFKALTLLGYSIIMDTKMCKLLPNMAFMIVITLICMINFYHSIADANEESSLATYIVHLELPDGILFAQSKDQEEWYQSFLPITTRSNGASSRFLYSYRNVITGFAARLSPEEVKAMEKKEGFVSARPQKTFDLHTTYTPYFLGLNETLGIWNSSNFGKGVIVGLLDTGITPNHPSFRDEGMPPPPAKWKGKCELVGMACNNKLIGAKAFLNGSAASPLDEWGHGTHTSSTAAGNFVKGANVLGNANGTAVGMAPLAHLAMYRVCLLNCSEIDILAGMDAAIEDGVDVLSISLGKGSHPFYADAIAMGAFAAIQKGIFVSCAAGNGGPFNASLSNEAPWILTVGASTIDRSIRTTVLLGNNYEFDGQSLFQPHDFAPTLLPLVYAGMNGGSDSAFCDPGTLNNTDVKGKVVLCERGGKRDRISKGETVKDAGGAAMILMNRELDGFSTQVDAHVLPATHVSFAAGQKIKNYINSTSNPTATILFRGTVIGENYVAPMVSSFSSRGPSLASPGILKPDIIGPGVSILAAWSFPLNDESDSISMFNVLSGTSMSCPHLTGIAALVKSVHPDWSPAAIKSAIMTTAYQTNFEELPIVDQTFLPADIFTIGSGHVNPSRVNDPGLVYDIKPDDYIPYLCGLGYSNQQVSMVTQRVVKCAEVSSIPEAQLNYPSFAVQLGSNDLTYTRTVTNVGEANSSYNLQLILPPGVNVSVKPDKLEFCKVNQQMTYHVTFRQSNVSAKTPYVEGFLEWISASAKYFVRIPISVKLV